MIARLYHRLFLDHWEKINRAAAEDREKHPGFDHRPLVVMIVVALVLIFQQYYGDRPEFELLFSRYAGAHYFKLAGFAWWAGSKVFGYLVIPIVVIKALGGRLSDYGLRLRGFSRHVWIYLALYLAIVPVIVIASHTRAFEATYPFYKLAARSWTDLFAWELMYAASFLALEVFFRGFMLFALERTMGAYAIFVMIVPYCMIHFNKPVTEVTGAIFAGIILGTLSMATRSIWCGVLIHISVAWSMDLLALIHTYGLPGSGRFIAPS
ncbi:MAG: CPBP family intramembrane glutamic endopeptidase [Polyangia bacterium]